jgi:hypothetical protein
VTSELGEPAPDLYLRRLAQLPPDAGLVDALDELCGFLPEGGLLALVDFGGEMGSVGLETAGRTPRNPLPLGEFLRRVVSAGETVHVRAGSDRLYRSAPLTGFLGDDELFVVPLSVRGQVMAAICYSAGEVSPQVRATLRNAAAAISLRLALETRPVPEVGPSHDRFNRAHALASEGRLREALQVVGDALQVRADLLPAYGAVARLPSCRCPFHREVTVEAGDEVLGRLRVHGSRPVSDGAVHQLVATVQAAALADRLPPTEPSRIQRPAANLGTFSDPPWRVVGSAAEADLAAPLSALLIVQAAAPGSGEGEADLLALLSAALGPPAVRTLMGARPGQALAVLARHDASAARRLGGQVHARGRNRGIEVRSFVSQPGAPSDLHRMIDEVERLARLEAIVHLERGVSDTYDFGVHSLLLDIGSAERLSAWALRLIGPLVRYDAEHRGNLVGTLEAYLETWGHLAQCASLLYVHPNTLKYRLRRIQEILSVDPHDTSARVELLIACYAIRAAQVLGRSEGALAPSDLREPLKRSREGSNGLRRPVGLAQ